MAQNRILTTRQELFESTLIFLFGGFFQIVVFCPECWDDASRFLITFCWAGLMWTALWRGSVHLVRILNRWVEWTANPARRLIVSLAGVTVVVYGSTFLIHFFFHLLIFETDYSKIIPSYSMAETLPVLGVTIGINAVMHGRSFLLNWRQAAIDIEKMKNEQLSSQYQSLKNQVNPHFLFNSLNALSSLVYDDQKKAIQFIRKLSEVYRYVLDKKDEEIVPVIDELTFTKAYIFLQQIRFGENFQVKIDGDDKAAGFLPPLALQLLVENAVKHNVVSDSKPLTLNINIRKHDMLVENVIQRKQATDSTGIGLSNLKARYKYLSNEEMTVSDDGSYFRVNLPILDVK